jgi:WD40 repeat protein
MDGTVSLYDVPSLERIASFQAHMNTAIGVAFSPDGLRLATSGSEWAVKLWDLSTHRELMTLPGQSLIPDAAFSPDSQWLITHGTEGKLHLWRAPSWEEIEAAENRPDDTGQGSIISVVDLDDNSMVRRREE